MKELTLTDLKHIMARHGARLKKALGQNFLADTGVLGSIADGAQIPPGHDALEIGPGAGTLTRQLSMRAQRVLALELDQTLAPVLAETLAGCENVSIAYGDAMTMDVHAACREHLGHDNPSRIHLAANLPYYITTPLLMRALEEHLADSLTLMVQREVGQRIAAQPGSSDFSALSAAAQYYCTVEYLFTVPPQAFLPPPKVHSGVVHLKRRPDGEHIANPEIFRKTVRAAFSQRRKTILNSLGSTGLPREQISAALDACGIDPGARAQTISSDLYERLAVHLYQNS